MNSLEIIQAYGEACFIGVACLVLTAVAIVVAAVLGWVASAALLVSDAKIRRCLMVRKRRREALER